MRKCGVILCMLLLSALLPACKGEKAAVMRLLRTQGTVLVQDEKEKELDPRENMGLYGGYGVGTRTESYGWITLDEDRLVRLDEKSAVDIEQSGRELELVLKEGRLFFQIDKPLEEDEIFRIRTSNMTVGIRGTCGLVSLAEDGHLWVFLLEGKVECTVSLSDGSMVTETVEAGERAELDPDGTIMVTELYREDVPGFVEEELQGNEAFDPILSGLEETRDPLSAYEGILSEMPESDGTSPGLLYGELVDFEGDGSPELLMISVEEKAWPDAVQVQWAIRKKDPDGNIYGLGAYKSNLRDGAKISLVESGGRRFVHIYALSEEGGINDYISSDSYYGSVAEEDGGKEDWGWMDALSIYWSRGEGVPNYYMTPYDERGFTDGSSGFKQLTAEEFAAEQGKYSEVRDLVISNGASVEVPAP